MPAFQKMLLKNSDQKIELILMKQKQYDLDSFVGGYDAQWTDGHRKLVMKIFV